MLDLTAYWRDDAPLNVIGWFFQSTCILRNLTIFRYFVYKGAPSVLQYTPKGTEEAVLLRNISSFITYDLVYTLVNLFDCLAYRWF